MIHWADPATKCPRRSARVGGSKRAVGMLVGASGEEILRRGDATWSCRPGGGGHWPLRVAHKLGMKWHERATR